MHARVCVCVYVCVCVCIGTGGGSMIRCQSHRVRATAICRTILSTAAHSRAQANTELLLTELPKTQDEAEVVLTEEERVTEEEPVKGDLVNTQQLYQAKRGRRRRVRVAPVAPTRSRPPSLWATSSAMRCGSGSRCAWVAASYLLDPRGVVTLGSGR